MAICSSHKPVILWFGMSFRVLVQFYREDWVRFCSQATNMKFSVIRVMCIWNCAQICVFRLQKENLETFDRWLCNTEALLKTWGHLNCEHVYCDTRFASQLVSRRWNACMQASLKVKNLLYNHLTKRLLVTHQANTRKLLWIRRNSFLAPNAPIKRRHW